MGAGASKEFGLPTGEELKFQIASQANVRFDEFGRRLLSGEADVAAALRLLSEQKATGDRTMQDYLKAAWQIRDNMEYAPSIDNFLDTHKENSALIEVGKLLIVKSILYSESKSHLALDRTTARKKFNFTHLGNSWIVKLFRILIAQRDFESFLEALDRYTFVSFNYDRCIHQFFSVAARQYFQLDDAGVVRVLECLNVVHPY